VSHGNVVSLSRAWKRNSAPRQKMRTALHWSA